MYLLLHWNTKCSPQHLCIIKIFEFEWEVGIAIKSKETGI